MSAHLVPIVADDDPLYLSERYGVDPENVLLVDDLRAQVTVHVLRAVADYAAPDRTRHIAEIVDTAVRRILALVVGAEEAKL